MKDVLSFYNSDPAYSKVVIDKLGFKVKRVEKYATLKLKELSDATFEEGYKKYNLIQIFHPSKTNRIIFLLN